MNIEQIISDNRLSTETIQQETSLDKDAFLKLMLQQMKYQDPLQPMDNEAMLSQMAQFSSLEQMSNINKNLEQSNASQSLMDATHLLGKEITVQYNNETVSGTVKAVNVSSGGPLLTLDNNIVATMDAVLAVAQTE